MKGILAAALMPCLALSALAAGGTDERFYVWEEDENPTTGLKKQGKIKAFGVCDEQWQLDLRNCANTLEKNYEGYNQ